jgi:hypothetical protein
MLSAWPEQIAPPAMVLAPDPAGLMMPIWSRTESVILIRKLRVERSSIEAGASITTRRKLDLLKGNAMQSVQVFLFVVFCLSGSSATQTEEGIRVTLTVPKAPWTVSLAGASLAIERQQVKPDGQQGYFVLTDSKNNITVSLFIEPVVKCKSSKECRDYVWKLGNPAWKNPENVVLSQIGDISCLELMVPEWEGRKLRQQNLYAEFVLDNYWVDLHISKVLYKPEEHKLFEDIVKSVKFASKSK